MVGILHMAAPDHWLTLCVLSQSEGWTRPRLFGLSLAVAVGHVALSVVLGFLILGAGLLLSAAAVGEIVLLTGAVMLVGGCAYAARSVSRKGEDPSGEGPSPGSPKGLTYFAVLGAALSPDLSILPTFVLAIPLGLTLAIDAAVVFAIASIATLATFVLVGSMGLAKLLSRVPEKYNDALVGVVVAAVGVYVLVYG